MLTVVLYTFLAAFLVLFVLMRYVLSKQQLRLRLGLLVDEHADKPSGLRVMIKRFSAYCESASWAKKQEQLLLQAGVPFTGAEFMVISLGLAFLGLFLLAALSGGQVLLAIAGGVLGYYLPTVMARRKRKKKQELVNAQIAPALTMMANSLRSGYSYMQAIDLVAKEMPYPLGTEFGIVVKEMNLGISTEDAFMNLVRRVSTDDLDLMVTAFLIQRQVGGNLAELLDNISLTIRERINMKQRINTLTAQGKLSGVVLCLLPIVLTLIMYLINPEYLRSFIAHPTGKLMSLLGVVLMGVGIIWMRKIVDIDV